MKDYYDCADKRVLKLFFFFFPVYKDNIVNSDKFYSGAEIVYWFFMNNINCSNEKYNGFWKYVDTHSAHRAPIFKKTWQRYNLSAILPTFSASFPFARSTFLGDKLVIKMRQILGGCAKVGIFAEQSFRPWLRNNYSIRKLGNLCLSFDAYFGGYCMPSFSSSYRPSLRWWCWNGYRCTTHRWCWFAPHSKLPTDAHRR